VWTGPLVPVWLRTEARVENSFKFLPERPMRMLRRNRSFARERDGLFPTRRRELLRAQWGTSWGMDVGTISMSRYRKPGHHGYQNCGWSGVPTARTLLEGPMGLRFGGGTMEGRRALRCGPWSVPSGAIRLHCRLAATARVGLPALTPLANRTFRTELMRIRVRARCAFEVP
jgi:hypothetical protein